MAQNDTQTDRQNHGHGDSMTDPAQRAESVKKKHMLVTYEAQGKTPLC